MKNKLTAQDARLNFGTEKCADKILEYIESISLNYDHAFICDDGLTVNQKEVLFKLGYRIKDSNILERIFLNRRNKISW